MYIYIYIKLFLLIFQKLLLYNNNYHGNRSHILQALLFIRFFPYNLPLNNNTFYCPSDIVLTHIKQYIHTYIYIYIIFNVIKKLLVDSRDIYV